MSLLNPMDDDPRDAVIEGLERIKELEAEIARLRLTDAEREAVATASRIAGAVGEDDIKATLRGLLERTK